MNQEERDIITIEDEEGNEKDFTVEALFDMEEQSYALLKGDGDTVLMRIEDDGNEQYLVGVVDQNEKESILDAYHIAVEATPNDIEDQM